MAKCGYCEKEIVGRRSDAKFCSSKCRLSEEKRRAVAKSKGVVPNKRGPNDGRSKEPGYYKARQQKAAEIKREKVKNAYGGYKGRYAPARVLGFRSMFEVKVAAEMEAAGIPFSYETLKLKYTLEPKTYTPDMVLENGIIIEAKGYFPAEDRQKMRAVKASNPDADIRFVFQKAGRTISKAATSSTYAKWAEKNGFPWSEGSIPEQWFNEKRKA